MEIKNIMLPNEFLERMKIQLGENFGNFLNELKNEAVRGIRINTNKISEHDFINLTQLPLEKIDYCKNGYVLNSDKKIGNCFYHLSGLCYLQEPSSMLAVCASEIEKENNDCVKVLDLCAAPGGKTGQIANYLNNALIYSNEIDGTRVKALYSNIERQGFKNVIILNEKPERLLKFENYFDYVFVDAPCSGEGMFRKNPDTIKEWSSLNVELCKKRQMQILEVAQRLVKAGGKLIYSTCTFSEEEDEQIVEYFANNFNFELQNVNQNIKNCTISARLSEKLSEKARKFLPFTGKGEGQFVAVFKNFDSEFERESKLYSVKHTKTIFEIGRSEKQIFATWAKQNLKPESADKILKSNLLKVGNVLYLSPSGLGAKEITALDELKFESLGTKLGHFEKGRFEPDHAIFMALYNEFLLAVNISEEEANKFMHGEQLACDLKQKGYVAITFNNYPLGGAKLADGKLKNLLPKALRI